MNGKKKDKKEEENSMFKYKKKTNEQWFKEKLKNSSNNNNSNNNKDFLNKKRSFLSSKEKEEKMELEASARIDRMLDEIRREKRVNQMIAERKKELEKKLKEKEKIEMKAKLKKKKLEKKKKSSNFFLDAMGITEEEVIKSIKEKEEKENEKENDLIFNNKNSITNDMGFGNIDLNILFKKQEEKPKYYNFKVSHDDIYKKVLSFEFYNEKLKTENIPDYFDNELHYRYIWIPDFFNELKYCLLNEKAEKSDCQNYIDADIKIKLHYLHDESNSDIACLSLMANRNLMELKKKILKDKDILAVYSENEKINNDEINISNKNNLRYFLAVVKREIDSYETKLIVNANDIKKFGLNEDNSVDNNSKNDNSKFYKVKYLNN